jgi:hypothetical protein
MSKNKTGKKGRTRLRRRRTTQKNKGRVWIFRKGSLVVSYRTPILHIDMGQRHKGGAESENDRESENDQVKEMIESIQQQMREQGYSDKDITAMESVLNRKDMCNIPGKLSSMASSTFQTLSNGANVLGKFLTPQSGNEDQYDENTVRIMWMPESSRHYRRGKSKAADKDDFRVGDLIIHVDDKYASTGSYLSGMFTSVEDALNDILKGKRAPIREHVVKTVNHQPQIKIKESMSSPIEIRETKGKK